MSAALNPLASAVESGKMGGPVGDRQSPGPALATA
jgi:hypothetical protein